MSTRDKILDVAEAGIRARGFSGISFRDIAKNLEIKSASVHYHFPTKAHLGDAVVERYHHSFMEALGPADDPQTSPKERIRHLAALYTGANKSGPCLCMVLGSVVSDLPVTTQEKIKAYFSDLTQWTSKALGGSEKAQAPAEAIISLLQGAMVYAQGAQSPESVLRIAKMATRLIPWGLRIEASKEGPDDRPRS